MANKVKVKDKNGNIITVYEDSIPALIAEGTLPAGTVAPTGTTPTPTPTSTIPTNLNTTPLGLSGVNALFTQYYGRNATQEELDYWKNKSDAELRPKLIPNSEVELARNKPITTSTPGTVTPPPTREGEGTTDADTLKQIKELEDYINSRTDLTETERQFLISTFVRDEKGNYITDKFTSGRTIPTNAEIAQWISDAAKNAETDISPYYTRISGEELADYKRAMANIRAKSETFLKSQESTYKQKLAETKQSLAARGLAFSGVAIRNIGQQAAVRAPTGYEGRLQEARRLGYEEELQGLGQQAVGISTAAERRLGSAAVTGALGEVGSLAGPADLTGLTTTLYTPGGQYTGVGSMASTIAQERAEALALERQRRLKRYSLTF